MSLAIVLSSLLLLAAQGSVTTTAAPAPGPKAQVPLRPLSFNFDVDMILPMDFFMGRPRPAGVTSVDDQIVVTAQRVHRVVARATTKRGTGELSCSMRRASGNPAFDIAICEELVHCLRMAIATPRIREMRESQESGRAIRRALEAPTMGCVNGFLQQWDERRG